MDSPSPAPGRERLRFADFQAERFSDGRCRARLILETPEGEELVGEATGIGTLESQLRCGAQAAIDAIARVTGERMRLELTGAKAIRAFDGIVVITALRAEGEKECARLLGVYSTTEEERIRGAALAVLNATNRILGNFIATTND